MGLLIWCEENEELWTWHHEWWFVNLKNKLESFRHGLIFAGKVRSLHKAPTKHSNIRLLQKGLSWTNALAYLASLSVTKIFFITLSLGINVKIFVRSYLRLSCNKLERLSQSLFHLSLIFTVKFDPTRVEPPLWSSQTCQYRTKVEVTDRNQDYSL